MTHREVCLHLGVSEKSLRNYVDQGPIPCIQLGRRKLYQLARIEEALRRLES